MDVNVKDKVVVITGAGGGIGRATALRFAAGGESLALAHDVSSEAAWLDILGRAEERFGGVDVLVNNAGIFIIAPIETTTLDQWEKIMAINVTGTFLGAKHVVAYLRKRGGGSIINMSSVSGVRGSANDAAYGASKGAVTLFTKHLAAELGSENIRVNAVAPTLVRTAMADYATRESGSSREELGRQLSVLGRLAEPDDVAAMVVFLASDEARYLTASTYMVDGGQAWAAVSRS
jgi:NAD(P)-dependent dehydrogenase (short-subunit alcohol dehydrogenase family)